MERFLYIDFLLNDPADNNASTDPWLGKVITLAFEPMPASSVSLLRVRDMFRYKRYRIILRHPWSLAPQLKFSAKSAKEFE